MRALPLSLGLFAVVSSTQAVAISESRRVTDFTAIEVSGGVRLEVKKGPTSLVIEGEPEVVTNYSTEVVGGVLRIKNKSRSWFKDIGELTVKVTTPSLSRLDASCGVRASLIDVAAPKFAVDLSGGVQLDAPKLALDSLELKASGGVTVNVSGKAQNAKINLSGGVKLKGKSLEIAQVLVDASGGCNAELSVKEAIVGDISGGVGLTVRGHPPKSQVHTSGGAEVKYLD